MHRDISGRGIVPEQVTRQFWDQSPTAHDAKTAAALSRTSSPLTTMESDLFLTHDEVGALTGYKTNARQVEWLRTKGWRFEISGNRRPIVARKYAEKMLGCGTPEPASYMPNFAALRSA